MPIGDWSNDGHGMYDVYKIESNKPIQDVFDTHFMINDKTGINLDEVCREYGNPYLKEHVAKRLVELGFFGSLIDGEASDSYTIDEDGDYKMYSYGLAKLWIFLLRLADLELKLTIVPDDLPVLRGWNNGRFVEFSGYGVFDV